MEALNCLALAARNGDVGALDRLVEGTYEQVWRLCARLVDEQSADDLAQDTFIRAVRSLPNFRGDASARTWLLKIARHACMDELRTRVRRRRRDLSPAPGRADRERVVADASQEVTVNDILARLVPERREAFVLTQLIGLSYEEAGVVIGCPTGTIRSRVSRARVDLLDALDQSGPACTSSGENYGTVTAL